MLRRMKYPKWLPYLLGFLTAVGPVSTDLYLPSFTAIEHDFGSPRGAAQITLAAWFVGFAIGQLMQGALTDWLGRRRPLIVGTVFYTFAAAGCALSPNMETLAFFRFATAIGGAASSVIARAIVRDHADGQAAAGIMAQLMMVTGVAPILAPSAGGFLLEIMSWRGLFWICTAYGAIASALVYFLLPESLPIERRQVFHPVRVFQRYGAILIEPSFATNALLASAGMFTVFAFLAGSPALTSAFHMSSSQVGLVLMAAAAPYIFAAQANPRLLRLLGMDAVIRLGAGVSLIAVLTMFAVARLGHTPLVVFIVLVMINNGAIGLVMPNAAISALSRHPHQAGSASALMGSLNFTSAAICSTIGGAIADGTMRPITLVLLIGSAGISIARLLRAMAGARVARAQA